MGKTLSVGESWFDREGNRHWVTGVMGDKLDIHVGEYWLDRAGNVHKIADVFGVQTHEVTPDFPIVDTLDMVWRADGRYLPSGDDYEYDLIKRVFICDKDPSKQV